MATIFVSNLPPTTTIAGLARLFETFASVESVRILLADLQPKVALIRMSFEDLAEQGIKNSSPETVPKM